MQKSCTVLALLCAKTVIDSQAGPVPLISKLQVGAWHAGPQITSMSCTAERGRCIMQQVLPTSIVINRRVCENEQMISGAPLGPRDA